MVGGKAVSKHPLASDARARRKAADGLARLTLDWRREHPLATWYSITLIYDTDAFIPLSEASLRIGALKKRAEKDLRENLKVDAVAVIELQPVKPSASEPHGIMPHVHAIGYSYDPKHVTKVRRALNKGRGKVGPFKAKSVITKKVKASDLYFLRVANYLFKPPYDATNVRPGVRGKYKFAHTAAGYPPKLALRLIEMLSKTEMREICFGIGSGTCLRTKLMQRVRHYHKARNSYSTLITRNVDVVRFWQRVAQRGNRGLRLAPVVVTRS